MTVKDLKHIKVLGTWKTLDSYIFTMDNYNVVITKNYPKHIINKKGKYILTVWKENMSDCLLEKCHLEKNL